MNKTRRPRTRPVAPVKRAPAGQIPETWLGEFLRTPSPRWADLLKVLGEVGPGYPDLQDFALQADLSLQDLPGATAEEILQEMNSRRQADGRAQVDPLALIGGLAGALAMIGRVKGKMILAAGEPRVMETLLERACTAKGVKDRENYLLVQGLLKRGPGVNVNVDASHKSLHVGGEGVEADNRAFQALMQDPQDIQDEGDESGEGQE